MQFTNLNFHSPSILETNNFWIKNQIENICLFKTETLLLVLSPHWRFKSWKIIQMLGKGEPVNFYTFLIVPLLDFSLNLPLWTCRVSLLAIRVIEHWACLKEVLKFQVWVGPFSNSLFLRIAECFDFDYDLHSVSNFLNTWVHGVQRNSGVIFRARSLPPTCVYKFYLFAIEPCAA